MRKTLVVVLIVFGCSGDADRPTAPAGSATLTEIELVASVKSFFGEPLPELGAIEVGDEMPVLLSYVVESNDTEEPIKDVLFEIRLGESLLAFPMRPDVGFEDDADVGGRITDIVRLASYAVGLEGGSGSVGIYIHDDLYPTRLVLGSIATSLDDVLWEEATLMQCGLSWAKVPNRRGGVTWRLRFATTGE